MIDNQEELFILDLRDQGDRKAGYIKDSINIPMVDLIDRYTTLPQGMKIVILDLHGKQSYIAARFLYSKGYTNLFRLDGGFVSGWIKAGFSVKK